MQTAIDLAQRRKRRCYGFSCCGGRVAGRLYGDERSQQDSGSGDSRYGRLLRCAGRVRFQGGRPLVAVLAGPGAAEARPAQRGTHSIPWRSALASTPVDRYANYIKNDSHLRYCQ